MSTTYTRCSCQTEKRQYLVWSLVWLVCQSLCRNTLGKKTCNTNKMHLSILHTSVGHNRLFSVLIFWNLLGAFFKCYKMTCLTERWAILFGTQSKLGPSKSGPHISEWSQWHSLHLLWYSGIAFYIPRLKKSILDTSLDFIWSSIIFGQSLESLRERLSFSGVRKKKIPYFWFYVWSEKRVFDFLFFSPWSNGFLMRPGRQIQAFSQSRSPFSARYSLLFTSSHPDRHGKSSFTSKQIPQFIPYSLGK